MSSNTNYEDVDAYLTDKDIATDKDLLFLLAELDLVTPVVGPNNEIYTASNGGD